MCLFSVAITCQLLGNFKFRYLTDRKINSNSFVHKHLYANGGMIDSEGLKKKIPHCCFCFKDSRQIEGDIYG